MPGSSTLAACRPSRPTVPNTTASLSWLTSCRCQSEFKHRKPRPGGAHNRPGPDQKEAAAAIKRPLPAPPIARACQIHHEHAGRPLQSGLRNSRLPAAAALSCARRHHYDQLGQTPRPGASGGTGAHRLQAGHGRPDPPPACRSAWQRT